MPFDGRKQHSSAGQCTGSSSTEKARKGCVCYKRRGPSLAGGPCHSSILRSKQESGGFHRTREGGPLLGPPRRGPPPPGFLRVPIHEPPLLLLHQYFSEFRQFEFVKVGEKTKNLPSRPQSSPEALRAGGALSTTLMKGASVRALVLDDLKPLLMCTAFWNPRALLGGPRVSFAAGLPPAPAGRAPSSR
ncbi:hypothetical protein Esti_002575 [Eimeria stiedai]